MEKSIGRLVSILYRKNQVYLNIALKKLNLTASELPILTYLFKHHGVSQEELSAYLAIDKAATARIVQSLMEKGFLMKEKDLQDRRANKLFLTDLAINEKEKIYDRLYQWNSYLTEGIDPEAVDTMLSVLEKMVKKLENNDNRDIWREI
ncbi:MAG: MarR family winged helix-turn-helix transcriptional regulator [Anaerocolumna sp.]